MAEPAPIDRLRSIMAQLRAPVGGCPWDTAQDFSTIAPYTIEEAYEVADAIDRGDMHDLKDELGDLLLQVVFHCQLARERGAFDFEKVCRHIVDKLIRRHPHVFGDSNARTVDAVWAQREEIKKAEKHGTKHARPSAFDGIPKHLPALLRAEKLIKKARKANLTVDRQLSGRGHTRSTLARELFALAGYAQRKGWSAEELLRSETQKREQALRHKESASRRSEPA